MLRTMNITWQPSEEAELSRVRHAATPAVWLSDVPFRTATGVDSGQTVTNDVQRYYRRSFILVLVISAIFLCITLSIVISLLYCWCKRATFGKKSNGVTARVEFAECADEDADEIDSDDRDDWDLASAGASTGIAPYTAGNNAGLGGSSDKSRLIPRSRSTDTHCSMYSNASFAYEPESETLAGANARQDHELVVNRGEPNIGISRSTTCSDGFRELPLRRGIGSRTHRLASSPLVKAFGLASALYSRMTHRSTSNSRVRRSHTQYSTNELLGDDVQCTVLGEPQLTLPPHSRSETQLAMPRESAGDLAESQEHIRQAKQLRVSALLRNDGNQQRSKVGINTQETAI